MYPSEKESAFSLQQSRNRSTVPTRLVLPWESTRSSPLILMFNNSNEPIRGYQPSKPGQWHLIVDLSSPQGANVNDRISSKWDSLAYVSVDQIVDTVLQLGQGSQLAKMDMKNAFRIIPDHPDDGLLLGMQWSGRIYADCVLPFGLRSAVADALQWCLRHKGIEFIYHYLDDFLCIGHRGKNTCKGSLDTMMQVCEL